MRQLEEEAPPYSMPSVLRPSVPPGLPELMEGLSREVLRHNPEDIYAFCAQHMKKLLKIREELNPTEKPMLKSKPPLTLEQKPKKLVHPKSEEHHQQYLKNVSTAMIDLKEKPGKLENSNEVENQTLNGYEVVGENSKHIEDDDVPVSAKFTENNKDVIGEAAKKENLDEEKEVEDNSVKKDSLVEKNIVDESESNNNKSISEENLVRKNVVGNESMNKAVLDVEKVSNENDNVNKHPLVKNIKQESGNKDKENLVEVRENLNNGKILKGKESVENIVDKNMIPVQETESLNSHAVRGNSDENDCNASLDKETSSLEENENLVETKADKSFFDKNSIENNKRIVEHKISEISENLINNIVTEGTKILLKSKPAEESIVEPQESEIVATDDKRIDKTKTSIENESENFKNSLINISQESGNNDSNKIAQDTENLPGTPIAEEQLSLTKDKEILDKSAGNENLREIETVNEKTLTITNTSEPEDIENAIANEKIGDTLDVQEPTLTIDQHNEVVVNEHIIDKISVEESTPKEMKMDEAEKVEIKDRNDNSANNAIGEVNRHISNEIVTQENKNLIDVKTAEEILDIDDTEKKRSENADYKSVKDTKDFAINNNNAGVVQVYESKKTETLNNEVKSGNLVTHTENKKIDSEITAKGSEGLVQHTLDKINGLHSHNENVPNEAHSKVIKTESVEVVKPFTNSLKGSEKLTTHNSSTKEDVELETKIAEQIITNDTTENNTLDGIEPAKTEKDSKENEVPIVSTEENINKINVAENETVQSNTTEEETKKINEISIDKNKIYENEVETNSIQMNTDAVHVSNKNDTENRNDKIEIGSIPLQNVPGSRKKQSIEGKDKHDNLKMEKNDVNTIENDIENKDGASNEKNEKLENADNFPSSSSIKNKESTTDKYDNPENDKNIISDEIKTQGDKGMSNNENETPNEKKQIVVATKTVSNNIEVKDVATVINKGKSAVDVVDFKILQNNAELMILSHADNENNSEDKNINVKHNIQDTKGQPQDNPNTENHTVSRKFDIEPKSESRAESTETTGDEQVQNSSNEKSSLAEEDSKISLHKDNNKILNTSESMDLETAAITMQKAFQAFLFESTTSNSEDNDNSSLDIPESGSNTSPESGELSMDTTVSLNERRPPGILTRANTVLQTVNEEKSLSLSTDESSGLSSAATVIQAHVRGFLVRNRLSSNKFTSSDTPTTSVEAKFEDLPRVTSAKTVLKINIPEQENFSIGDSIDTSVDLPIDPVHSVVNLHPLGYDKDARKPLKREDAIQSISPPSNSSAKLSEEANSPPGGSVEETTARVGSNVDESNSVMNQSEEKTTTVIDINNLKIATETGDESKFTTKDTKKVLARASSDETDVVTPFKDGDTPRLLHSSEFHDILLPTQVVRKDSSVVREFKCVLGYFIKWHST